MWNVAFIGTAERNCFSQRGKSETFLKTIAFARLFPPLDGFLIDGRVKFK